MHAALWGLLGSGVAEALTLSASMRPTGPRRRWRWPWSNRADRPVMLVAIILRLFAGAGLTAALGASGQLSNATMAFVTGLATPFIVARLFQSIPVGEPGQPQTSPQTGRRPIGEMYGDLSEVGDGSTDAAR
ncbi:hypothetical protein [Streptomyces sp. UG1]|uniref:hypothetical protein n=1 Tax=Streptomyces sp. UG1 TaxID=3417652 RepID=UPI003CFB5B67